MEDTGLGFAVYPLSSCPHDDTVQPVPKDFCLEAVCETCSDTEENWLCLICFKLYCGRHRLGHGIEHFSASGHSIALSYCDLSIWCHACDSYVSNSKFSEAKSFIERIKFPETVG